MSDELFWAAAARVDEEFAKSDAATRYYWPLMLGSIAAFAVVTLAENAVVVVCAAVVLGALMGRNAYGLWRAGVHLHRAGKHLDEMRRHL